MSYELKDLVGDEVFVEKINTAFADLRADYELELDESKEQIEKLNSIGCETVFIREKVNIKNNSWSL